MIHMILMHFCIHSYIIKDCYLGGKCIKYPNYIYSDGRRVSSCEMRYIMVHEPHHKDNLSKLYKNYK